MFAKWFGQSQALSSQVALKTCTSAKCGKQLKASTDANLKFLPELITIRTQISAEKNTMSPAKVKKLSARVMSIMKEMANNPESHDYGKCIVAQCQSQLKRMMADAHKEQQALCSKGQVRACDRSKKIEAIVKKDKFTLDDRKKFIELATQSRANSRRRAANGSKK
jgi:hypothetical protein